MYLTQLKMDLLHPSIRQALKDRQDLHRDLSQSFQGNFLYRVTGSRQPELLVLSENEPDLERLEKRGLARKGSQDVSPLQDKYQNGSILHFNLLAAPSKKKKEDGRENSRRVFLATPELRAEWLKHQGEKYGFEMLEAHEPSAETVISISRKSGPFIISAVEFAGVLKIADSPKFWKSWEKGIGPEKAYGLGLMLLSR